MRWRKKESPMRCRSVLTRIDAMRTGELASTDRDEIHEHIGDCRSCNESVADVDVFAQTIKSLAAAPPRSCRDAVTGKCSDSYARITASGETVWVAFTDRGLRMIHRGGTLEDVRERYANRHARTLTEAKLPEKFRKQVEAALRGEGVDVDALEALARKNVRFIGSKTTKIVCFPTCRDARRIREENRVPFQDAAAAEQKGFRPCRKCQPFAARTTSSKSRSSRVSS